MTKTSRRRTPLVSGETFGRLSVIREVSRDKHGNRAYECLCICGAVKTVRGSSLTSGHTQSCGCLHHDGLIASPPRLKHGHGHYRGTGKPSPTYRSWRHLVARCTNPSDPAWDDYGGRGITVCEQWVGPEGFGNFLAAMGEKPPGTSIDRIDNESGYRPDNCRWATPHQQRINSRPKRTPNPRCPKTGRFIPG